MKKGLTKILTLGSIALLALASCTKNDAKVTLNAGGTGALSASTAAVPLDRTKITDTTKVITFTTTPPKFGFNAAVTSTLQIDADGDNWKNPVSVTLGTKVYSQGYSTLDFDNMLLKLNLPAGTSAKIDARIQFSLSTAEIVYSNVVSVTATPFNLSSWLYVVGAFQGWSTSSADSLESATGNGIYTGVIYFTPNANGPGQNQFLILPTRSFNTKYCTAGGADTTGKAPYSYASEFVSSGGNNFVVPTAGGYYIVTLDNNANTLTLTPSDYYSVTGNEVVGGDWGVDQFMKYINDGSNTWTKTLSQAPVSGGGFKIRYDAQWTYSWGTPQSASVGAGKANTLADDKDDNLAVTVAGNYTTTIVAAPTVYGATPSVLIPYTFNGK